MRDVTDPNKLTKEQLFEVLSELGVINLPAKRARKKELVEVYLKHVSGDRPGATTPTRDEAEIVSKSRTAALSSIDHHPLNKLTMPPSKKTEPPAEVTLMSNAELADALRERGVDVGPIIATTRKVYERKLTDLLVGGGQYVSASEEESMEQDPYEDEEEEEEEEEPETLEAEPVIVPKATRYVEQRETIRQRAPIRDGFTEEQYTSRSYQTSSTKSSLSSSSQPGKPQTQNEAPKAKGMSLLVKLIIFLLLAGLVYLVVVNMESIRPKPAALSGDPEAGRAQT